MFKKNLKSLSLFLILLVLMIGAISAVSAADAQDGGYSNITISDAADVDAIQDITDLDAAASEDDAVELTIVTEGRSSQSYEGTYVPDGTPVYADEDPITFDGNVYFSADEDSVVEGVVAEENTLIADLDGVYTGTLEITDGADILVNGTIYYAGILVPAGSLATYTDDFGTVIVSQVEEDTILYVPFTYVSLYEIEITEESEEIDYGGEISFNGTVTENTLIPISDDANIRVTLINSDDDEYTISEDDIDFEAGVFIIDGVETVLDADGDEGALPADTYRVVVELYDTEDETIVYAKTETVLVVNGINVTLAAELDDDVVEFDGPAILTVTLDDDVVPTFIISATNQVTGVTYDIDELEYDDDEDVYVGEMTYNGDNLPVGTYLVTVVASAENFEFNTATLTYTVEAAETTITADPNPVYVTEADEEKTIGFVISTENTEDLDVTSGVTAVLRDENGIAIAPLEVDYDEDSGNTVTVDVDYIEDGYYVSLDYVDSTGSYKSSRVNVPLYIREGTEMETDPTAAEFNYGEEGPVVTITLKDGFGEDASTLEINTTVSVSIDGVPIDTEVTLTDGVGVLNLTDLGLDAGEYDITFSYVDEDDVYMPCEAIVVATVYPINSYILNVEEDEFTYTVNSDDTVEFYLTLSTNSSVIADYTGDLSYTNGELDEDGELIVYTIPVVDGFASIPVSELEGLVYDADDDDNTITYTFFVDGNEVSNSVDVEVTIELLDGEIFTENVTTYEDTGFIIDGFVSNVTGGKVSVALMDEDEEVLAVVFADVDEESGYFAASFGGLPEGNYTAGFSYDGEDATIPAANEIFAVADVIVSGEAPEPTPTNVTYATVLTIDPFNETEGAGKSLIGRLTLEDGTPVIGMHILLNLTRLSDGASKVYTTTTDYNGEFQFPINLGAGEYTAQATFEGVTIPSTNVTYNATESPVTPFSVTKNGTPTNETTVVIIPTPYVGTYGTPGNFTVQFLVNGEPIVGIPGIEITLTRLSSGASKTYTWFVTDYNGEINMPIELAPGDYTAHIKFNSRTEPYVIDGAEADTTITVKAAA